MKKILCIIAYAFLIMHMASAQEVLGGRIMISGLDVARTDGNLFVSMDMDLSSLNLKTDRELIVTPVLYTGTDSLSLSPVVIAGRNRYFHHLRNGISPEEAALYREGSTSVVEYRAVVPYSGWMGRADLRLDGLICGCCGAPVDGESDFLSALDMEPRVFMPSFVYLSPEGEAVKMRVEKGSAYIDFPVNRTEIYEDYRSNAGELSKIRSTIELVRNDPDTRITSVSIKGYASPEGPYDNNVRLAKGRTRTLKEYVRRQYDFPDSLMHTSYEPEDWDGLERFVRGSGLAGRDGILEVIAGGLAPDAKEWKIKSSWPEDYAFLLKEVYPGLRHSDYAVEYEVRTYTDADEIRSILRTRPQKLSLQEMYLAAQQMEPGSDEYNETFEIAVRMFPDDPAANLNAANSAMSRGDLKNAGRYLAKAGQCPEAVYARGILAALSGEYDSAGKLFGEAAVMGISQAEEALESLSELY
jgi:hypothetical protein